MAELSHAKRCVAKRCTSQEANRRHRLLRARRERPRRRRAAEQHHEVSPPHVKHGLPPRCAAADHDNQQAPAAPQSVCCSSSLPQSGRQVLEAVLNCS